MRTRHLFLGLAASLAAGGIHAAEFTVKNDSLTDFSSAVIVSGFVSGEKAASWLTSPCTGDIRAVQVFWRSASGTTGQTIHDSIEIFRNGTFPTPGTLAETIGGPIMNDGVINEFRYLDENNVIPLVVPVTMGETFVVSFTFDSAPPAPGPSVVRDTDGIQPNRNAIYADIGATFAWFNASTLGVTGDWVIRAVVDCPVAINADVGSSATASPSLYTAGQPLTYTLTISNSGPAASPSTTIVDVFPSEFQSPTWSCIAAGGASCTSGGSGNITQIVSLPVGGEVVYTVNGTVGAATTGILTNSVSAVVGSPATDPASTNNTATVQTGPASDRIFASDFDP